MKEPYKIIKITVLTPKNQAKPTMERQKTTLLGFTKPKQILEEKLIAHNKFSWTIPIDDEKDERTVTKRLVRGEIYIKRFYRTLIKTLDRANKLGNKFKKGARWIKNRLIKQLRKQQQDDIATQVEGMDEKEIMDFIKINDREEILELMNKDLITIKEQKNKSSQPPQFFS